MPAYPPANLPNYFNWESAHSDVLVANQSRTTANSGVPKVSDEEFKKRTTLAKQVLAEIEEKLQTPLSTRDYGIAQNLRGKLKELLGLNKTKPATETETPAEA